MRKVLIDKNINNSANAYLKSIESKGLLKLIKRSINRLIVSLSALPNSDGYVHYLRFVLFYLPQLIVMHPIAFEPLARKLDAKWHCDMNWLKTKTTSSFAERLVNALHYDKIRAEYFPEHVPDLKIKTCVYCNTQYALTTKNSKDGSFGAYYELDHAWPKSKYPFLAISFFNLQPCCGPCNRRKSDSEITYSIYVEQPALSSVQFYIEDKSLGLFDLYHIPDDLSIEISVGDYELDELYNKIGVRALYATMKDEAAELVWKHKIFSDSYIKQLSNTYSEEITFNKIDITRLLYGVYDWEDNVYLRPLSKFRLDILQYLRKIT